MLHQLDSNFIIIKQWVSEDDRNILFDHTKKIREKRNRSKASISGTILTRTVKITNTGADPGKAVDSRDR